MNRALEIARRRQRLESELQRFDDAVRSEVGGSPRRHPGWLALVLGFSVGWALGRRLGGERTLSRQRAA